MPDNSSRRDLLKGAAVAGIASAAAPALAQGAQPPAQPTTDPQSKYTSDPFPEQRQKWPALQRDMKPVPDSGETSYRGTDRLQGRKALITGGDSGIGRAAAIAYAREGADVAINYYPTEEPDARDLQKLLQAEGRKLVLLPGDLTDQKFTTGLAQRAAAQLGGLDILVNNAAYQQSKKSIDEITLEQFDRTMKTNVYAMFWLSKAALPLMKPGSVIINTGSVNSVDPGEELLDYASTKGAILVFTKGLAKQVAKQGIRVNMVAPGPIWTPLQVAGGQLPGKLGEFGQDTPLGRAGQPAELAGLYVTLAEGGNSYTTGSTLGANGGMGTL
jgi:NAD(P)-dependent dehydrogenase (short-subunit alcohol dehydrogenase family)